MQNTCFGAACAKLCRGLLLSFGFLTSLTALAQLPQGETLRLVVQPIQNEARTREVFTPMAEFISAVTGRPCVLQTYPNFLSYWTKTQQPGSYDLALDAAHFTDYRITNQNFVVLVKQPGDVSFSIVVAQESLVFDPIELVGKDIATLGSPSVGAVRLDQLFTNPSRQPLIVEVDSAQQAMDMVGSGEIMAAIVPTPLVTQRMNTEGDISLVSTTDPLPHIALSAAPTVPIEVRDAIRKAFVEAAETDAGKRMLEATNLPGFEATDNGIYAGHASLLDEL